jgi:hypothetical protein
VTAVIIYLEDDGDFEIGFLPIRPGLDCPTIDGSTAGWPPAASTSSGTPSARTPAARAGNPSSAQQRLLAA